MPLSLLQQTEITRRERDGNIFKLQYNLIIILPLQTANRASLCFVIARARVCVYVYVSFLVYEREQPEGSCSHYKLQFPDRRCVLSTVCITEKPLLDFALPAPLL